jgi:multisubunit Na+/H+ antiporter MnhB subunit
MAELLLDLLLAGSLALVAWSALRARELQAGIVLFIAFGLLMALAWARLEAPDLALAEAAIGAGITGAVLLEALARIGERAQAGDAAAAPKPSRGAPIRALAALAATGAALAIGAAILAISGPGEGLRPVVLAEIPRSGVEHPVTAVLLNFRAYDTWLEVAVLLAAVAGILAVLGARDPDAPTGGRPGELLGAFTRGLVPLMLLVGLYLLWRGTSGPGGAFQAGAVLGAAGILLYATRVGPRAATLAWRHRGVLVAGVAAFAALGAGGLVAGEALLTYPDRGAGALILAIEAAVTLAIAGALAAVLAAISAAAGHREGR